ncbi:MAG: hypothetical protein ACKVZJ_07830 [Phycisphaerales bacterium]
MSTQPQSQPLKPKTPMTPEDAARINSANDKAQQDTGKESFGARANSAAAKNASGDKQGR